MDSTENLFEAIFDQAAVGIAQISLDGAWLRVNKRYCQMLGYSEVELRGKTIYDISYPDDYAEVSAGRRQLLEGTISTHSMDKRYIRRDGSVFWGRLHRSLVRSRDNQPQYFVALVEDISAKIQAEHALRDTERRLALAQNAAQLGVWDADLLTGMIATSGEYHKLYGLAPDHPPLTNEEWLGLVHPEDRQRVRDLLRDTLKRTHVWDSEFRVVWPDGSIHWLLGKGAAFLSDSGRPERITGVNLDITERKRVEEALRQSEHLNAQILDNIPVCIFVLDVTPEGRFKFAGLNPAEEKAVGLSSAEVEGKFVDDVLGPEVADKVTAQYRRCLETGSLIGYEGELDLAIGRRFFRTTLFPLRGATGGIYRIVGCCVDLTEERRTHEEALARQRLETVGVLARGIAHDFNNLLGGILSSTESALTERAEGSRIEEDLLRIRTASIRGAEIVRQVMLYAGEESLVFEPLDISAVVNEMLQLLKVSVSKQAILTTHLAQGLPTARANATQIRQVVMNLLTNASEAIGPRGGEIRVATALVNGERNGSGYDPSLNGDANLADGDYLRLEVSDTGSGMTPEVQARIFDPYFTTKSAGRGLGLAAVQGIIRRHGGAINVLSKPGQGSTFEILLPCGTHAAGDENESAAPVSFAKCARSTATILVVEDEEGLRHVVSKMLQKRGFTVIEAEDGGAGVDLFRTRAPKINVVLLDLTLPGLPGPDVLARLRRIRPDVKVIVTTAYTEENALAAIGPLRPWFYLRKPYQFNELADLLQKTLFDETQVRGSAGS